MSEIPAAERAASLLHDAHMLDIAGQHEQAERFFRAALKIDPTLAIDAGGMFEDSQDQ